MSTHARLAAVALLAACGKAPTPVDSGAPDAGAPETCLDADAGELDAGTSDGGDFSCLGQPRPAGAVSALSISGLVTAAGLTRKPVVGAQVELFDPNGAGLDSVVTTDGGRFGVGAAIACAPLAGALRASNPDAGFYDAWYYPPLPWQRSRTGLELVLFDSAARTLVSALATVTVQNGTGALALAIEDCAGTPVAGATVVTEPAGDVRYIADTGFPQAALGATSSKGQLLVFNLPPGAVTVTATAGGQTLRVRTVTMRADAISSTVVVP